MKINFLDSFWKPSFYQDKSNVLSFGNGLLRLVLVNLCIGIITATVLHATFGKKIDSYVESASARVVSEYPSSLVLTLHDGTLSKNIPGAIKLYKISDFFGEDGSNKIDKDEPVHLIAIDDSQVASLAAFNASQAVVFLGKDGMVVENNNEIQVQSYKDMGGDTKEMSFSKDMLVKGVDIIKGYMLHAPTILFVAVVIGYTLFGTLAMLVSTLFYGLVIMVLSTRLLGRKYIYSESYVLSLYALASVTIIETLISYIPKAYSVVNSIPFFTTILVVVFLWRMFAGRSPKSLPVDVATAVVH